MGKAGKVKKKKKTEVCFPFLKLNRISSFPELHNRRRMKT